MFILTQICPRRRKYFTPTPRSPHAVDLGNRGFILTFALLCSTKIFICSWLRRWATLRIPNAISLRTTSTGSVKAPNTVDYQQ